MGAGHDYTGNLEQINRRLGRLDEKVDDLREQQAATNEHLRSLNGHVARHEKAITGMSRAVERNTANITNIDDRTREDRAMSASDRDELIRLRISAKGEEVEQDQATEFIDRLKGNWDRILTGIMLAIILARVFEL